MRYETFHAGCIGAAHTRNGLPCQDSWASVSEGGRLAAVVSDGHGSRRHFRSERGSAMACAIALEQIRRFWASPDGEDMEQRLQHLKLEICRSWRAAVAEDLAAGPWTEAELEEQRAILTPEQLERLTGGADFTMPYGCTLCAVWTTPRGWAAVQLGDGCLTVVGRDGEYQWPMPESRINQGHWTASLCSPDPMEDFRHVWADGYPAGLLVYTDGIEKTFPSKGKEIVSLLYWVWQNQRSGSPQREGNLLGTLERLTQRSRIGDDMSIAGIVDLDGEDLPPVAGRAQQEQELSALSARLEELRNTIVYNRERLRAMEGNPEQEPAAEQIRDILRHREEDAAALLEEVNALRERLGLPPELPPEEPEAPPEDWPAPQGQPEVPPEGRPAPQGQPGRPPEDPLQETPADPGPIPAPPEPPPLEDFDGPAEKKSLAKQLWDVCRQSEEAEMIRKILEKLR